MKKMSWLDKPITWRTSIKACAIGVAISLVGIAIEYLVSFWNPLVNLRNSIKKEEPSVEEQEEE